MPGKRQAWKDGFQPRTYLDFEMCMLRALKGKAAREQLLDQLMSFTHFAHFTLIT
jgi:hypothetical protein